MRELPIWERAGVLDAAACKRVESYYAQQTEHNLSWGSIAFAVLGALLIGGGILLVFAHNWELLTRPVRAALSLCPLLIGGVVSFMAIRRGRVAWCEFSGIFHALAVGAAIALIGQTYHLPSNTPGFLLVWALLVLPLSFVLPSLGAFLIYLALIGGWAGAAQSEYGHALGFWLLLLPALVRLGQLLRKDRAGFEALLALWGLILLLVVALGLVLERTVPGLWLLAYASFFSLLGLLGLRFYPAASGWSNPLGTLSWLGMSIFSYILTWEAVWDDIGWISVRSSWNYQAWGIGADLAIIVLFATAAGVLMLKSFATDRFAVLTYGAFAFLACLGFYLSSSLPTLNWLSSLLFNCFVLSLGLVYLVRGSRAAQLRQVNYGMAILALLLVTRFFDSDIGFLLRGMVFIVMGVGFLATNLLIARKQKYAAGGAI
ncbi:MAG: putative membrane protein [Lentimonas sp.]|jgi:uncharacterized membrane protein